MFNFFGGSKKITEKLYEQNLELAVKNKTLSLLERLYQTSVLNLTPVQMSKEITDTICKDLNFEFAGVLIFNKETDSLVPLSFSKSQRLVDVLLKLGFTFHDIAVTDVSKHSFFKQTIYGQKENITENIEEVWKNLINSDKLKEIKTESHIKTILVYPLIEGSEAFGTLLLGFNRAYTTLSDFEKESVKSFINVIALLLDKAYLYKNLQDSYEVTRKAYAVEKKANEELEQLDRVKNQFLSQTQHDLRTPLTSIMGYTDLLQKGMFGKQNKKTAEVIKKLQGLTDGMIKKANNFLDLAQFQLGKSVVELKSGINIFDILEEIKNELDFKVQSKGIYLNLEKPEKEFLISADREKLKAAIFNIVDNSVKYTQKGGVGIKIQNHDAVKIIISDTGIGIAPDKVGTIFDSMYDRSEQAKKTASGAGVGLYLSTQIIKAHNGKVWAESEGEGKGSTFYIEFPLE